MLMLACCYQRMIRWTVHQTNRDRQLYPTWNIQLMTIFILESVHVLLTTGHLAYTHLRGRATGMRTTSASAFCLDFVWTGFIGCCIEIIVGKCRSMCPYRVESYRHRHGSNRGKPQVLSLWTLPEGLRTRMLSIKGVKVLDSEQDSVFSFQVEIIAIKHVSWKH